jgi:P4 family phage/plasmid primase-like protien
VTASQITARLNHAGFLFDGHRRELSSESAIDSEVIAERGYRSVGRPTSGDDEPRRRLARLGIPGWAYREDSDFPGLLIPMYGPTGQLVSHQWKPRRPVRNRDGKPMKYASPKGCPNRLDVHPRNVRYMPDPTVELWITEGVKKGDALTSQGLCAIALTGVYNWRSQHGTLGEWEDVQLKGRLVVVCFDADARTNRNVARAMARFGRWLRSRGATVAYLVVPPQVGDTPVKGVDDFFAAGGSVDQLRVAMKATPPDLDSIGDAFTDSRMAETVADDVLADRFIWLAGLGWLSWNGRVWTECSDATVGEAFRQYVLDRFAEESQKLAAGQGDKDTVKGWLVMQSVGRQRSVLSLARGIVERKVAELDRHPDLLNTPSGVVDLRTGDLLGHDPNLLMTKIAGAEYRPGATHPDWAKALEAVPADTRDWLQLRLGQAITGHMTPDDVLIVFQGGGENGKSTINEATARAAGEYFLLASHRLLTASPDQHPTELMDLQGRRYVVAEETPEARRLSVVRLKQTVGTPQITARRIAKDSVTFDATHSMFVSSNYRPVVEETDHGTWRRLLLVRFPYTFRKPHQALTGPDDRRGDPGLRQRVKDDPAVSTAVLAWMVEGARRWYEHADRGELPQPPARVIADTRAWRSESDQVLAYLIDRIRFDPRCHVAATDLLRDLNGWLTAHGHHEWSDRTLTSRLEGHDELIRRRVAKRRVRCSPQTAGGLSRPEQTFLPEQLPSQYTAYIGLRFAATTELDIDQEEPASDDGGVQGVQGVQATSSA